MKLETSRNVTKSKRSLHSCRSISKKISVHVLLQYQSKSYYIIGQEVYYSIGRFITLSGSYYIIGRFLLHYRAVITVSGVYYIIGWYTASYLGQDGPFTVFAIRQFHDSQFPYIVWPTMFKKKFKIQINLLATL